ncbi:sialate O-acetylesterase-like isoform X2 [Mercenaria mercenaria]|nr:sialate O-acetylesterase-like isoform X2 [Mercenaria mercenaria]
MVLQKAPKSSQIWGYADKVGDTVTVHLGSHTPAVSTTVYMDKAIGRPVWIVMLPPQNAAGPENITISSSEGRLTITDVMFGDVWLCSGQSNMQFTLSMVFNASQEIADAVNYPDIRLFTAAQKWSNKTEYELLQVEQYWSRPNKDSVGHSDWSYFSAVCWLFGKYLYQKLKYPIGLISTDWGGTPVEAWSSRDAMDTCNGLLGYDPPHVHAAPQNTPTQLWNSMIHPFLNLTIYGAIWYQGEANAGAPDSYKCRFPAMIDDWRQKFHEGSRGQTDDMFPFGFVQLAPWRNDSTIEKGFPDIRWHQTADFGYVPNYRMPKTFMAVAVDLPDFTSPYNSIHPRDKQDVASRLVLSALPVAYNIKSMGKYQGPRISAYFIDIGYHTLTLALDNGTTPITVRSKNGFEVCCSRNNQSRCDGTDSKWIDAPIIASGTNNVTVSSCNGEWTMGIRYLWRESPCTTVKMCPVYTVENELPMAPFITVGLIGDKTNTYY